MKQATTRRTVLRLLAGAPLLIAGGQGTAAADMPKVRRLIAQAQGVAKISQRIDLISRGLIGARYQAHTLIGGARRAEALVVRDDAFDCVTFCEVVLAAAIARDLDAFEPTLRLVRYHHGKVDW